jgi:hypothetical protein
MDKRLPQKAHYVRGDLANPFLWCKHLDIHHLQLIWKHPHSGLCKETFSPKVALSELGNLGLNDPILSGLKNGVE